MDCLFCKIVAGEIPSKKIYEDEDFIVFLDIKPVNAGHALIVPKAHHDNFLSLPEESAIKAVAVAKKIIPVILTAVGATDFNLTLNNGSSAGQIINHFHWHIIPRFAGDGYKAWVREGDDIDSDEVYEKIIAEINR